MVEVTTMPGHDEQDQSVANPDRTMLNDVHDAEHAAKPEKRAQDQPWPDVAEEVEEAVKKADGPL